VSEAVPRWHAGCNGAPRESQSLAERGATTRRRNDAPSEARSEVGGHEAGRSGARGGGRRCDDEEIHKAIADLPLDVLERLDLFKETARNVRKIQDTSIGAIYDVIRKVDREVARLATEVLERAPRARPRPKAARPKVTRISARA
jgi:hypothetical protein